MGLLIWKRRPGRLSDWKRIKKPSRQARESKGDMVVKKKTERERKKRTKLQTYTVKSSIVIRDVKKHHVRCVFVVMSQSQSICAVLSVVSVLPL